MAFWQVLVLVLSCFCTFLAIRITMLSAAIRALAERQVEILRLCIQTDLDMLTCMGANENLIHDLRSRIGGPVQ